MSIATRSPADGAMATLEPGPARTDISRDFIRAKRPCADGYRWYLKRAERQSGYQALLDDLVREGRVGDACWLLEQFGPTDDVLRVDAIDAEALVFAGSIECRGPVAVETVLRSGRSLRTDAGLEVGRVLQVGEDLRSGGALACEGTVRIGGDARVGWSLRVREDFACGGRLRIGWDVEVGGEVRLGGPAVIGHGLAAAGRLSSDGGIRCGGDVVVDAAIEVRQGIVAAGAIRCNGHLHAGWGLFAGDDILATGAIRAGETLQAGGVIESGTGFGVYAGLDAPMDAWERCGFIRAAARPQRLLSGWWAGG